MYPKLTTLAIAALCVAGWCRISLAQTAPPVTVLEIDQENGVTYYEDVGDPSKFASSQGATEAVVRNFQAWVFIADIVAVNGRPAKGTVACKGRFFRMLPNPGPSFAIADVTHANLNETYVEIQQADGTPVGVIMSTGFTFGPRPPGAPAGSVGNLAIAGGTGAFVGARGFGVHRFGSGGRTASSMTEDPANRRVLGGLSFHLTLHLIPMTRPEVVMIAGGPAIVHASDFTLVTASKPARAGEILSLFATGLGPTRPGIDAGKPFPADPLQVANSPVEVTVNGKSAEVLAAVGFPGSTDGYQVNFRMPGDTVRGSAAVQVSAAWVAGSEVKIAVQ